MSHLKAIFLLGIASLILACPRATGFVRYGYSGVNGPDKWGSLSSDFSLCSQGKKQSPINIAKNITSNDPDLKPADRNYNKTRATIINNGLNIEVRSFTRYDIHKKNLFTANGLIWQLVYEKGPGIMAVDGKNYTLEKMVWHLPAEHTLDGESFPMELQLIHKSADNNITVVAILYQYGSNDAFLLQLQDELQQLQQDTCTGDEEARIPVGLVQTRTLVRHTRKYFRYVGSLTTPPCTEDVIWIILGKVRKMTEEQANLLRAPLSAEYKNNSRPTQPINGRTVRLYDEMHQVKNIDSNKSDKNSESKSS
ncbi:hypothetical protein ZIOFF_055955 [Zingiber officinale]|uniref:Alpha-carbonic anhydrase domain-containing protein n=1 Tax=Zingiber officinale TaxID=94328 RepID=A0A8J5KQ95_ZINOF|nr:hypothetical protein ZIOFF_055955 [Zingiber officinale]